MVYILYILHSDMVETSSPLIYPIHTAIIEKLDYFRQSKRIPNILFHGPSGGGKRTLLKNFIADIYQQNREKITQMVMYVNCSHGKGIKFIREDLKLFAKTNIHSNGGSTFKSVVLLNADKLTVDAQSALRRCIELFSHTTRFFIIAEDKYSLMKPILSRFCEIYIPEPTLQHRSFNLHERLLEDTFGFKDMRNNHYDAVKKDLMKIANLSNITPKMLIEYSQTFYNKGYSANDIAYLLEHTKTFKERLPDDKKYEILVSYECVKKEWRNEKLLFLYLMNFLFLSLDTRLENMSVM